MPNYIHWLDEWNTSNRLAEGFLHLENIVIIDRKNNHGIMVLQVDHVSYDFQIWEAKLMYFLAEIDQIKWLTYTRDI